jgi:hypothetical protein
MHLFFTLLLEPVCSRFDEAAYPHKTRQNHQSQHLHPERTFFVTITGSQDYFC